MIFLVLTFAFVSGLTLNDYSHIDNNEIYQTRDFWYNEGKLTITTYEKEGIGYIRFEGVHKWSFKWDKCNGSTRFLIR